MTSESQIGYQSALTCTIPGAKMHNKFDNEDIPSAVIIGQKEALEHLGGLQQIYRWFLDIEDDSVLYKE